MHNSVKFLSRCCPAMLLGCCLVSTPVAAAEAPEAAPVRLKSMSQAEYEAYREQLQNQVKEAAVNTGQDKATETEAEKELSQSEDSGYGRGYHSRTERSGRTGSGYRSGAMSRGGGGSGGRGR